MAKRRGHGEGAIYQRESDGKWCASVDLGFVNGKRRRKVIYGETRKEVADKLKALHRDQAAGVSITTEHQTLAHFLEMWLEQTVKRFNAASTYQKYAAIVHTYIIPAIGKYKLGALTPAQVQNMLNDILLAPASVGAVRAVLRKALNQAMKYGYVTRNVATLVDVPTETERRGIALTLEQVRKLLDALKGDRYEVLYRLALGLGLRRGELCALRWQDVDFDRQEIRISGSVRRMKGGLVRSEPKTKASARTIALPPVLFRALRKHKDRQECERAEQGEQWKDSGYVFTSTIGTPCEPAKILKRFKAALTEAELPDTIRLHDLRHSCATFLIEQGEHPRVVMEILGHSQIATTMNIYSHVFPHTQRDALLGIDELFNDEQEQGEGEDEDEE